jgi:microcystin-dependent protein
MDPVIGEIRLFAGTFAPLGWADCNGQLLSIGQNAALFALIGTTYGGDGQTTFALPDLRSRVPIGMQGGNLGAVAGTETVTLTEAMMPTHSHPVACGGNATTVSPMLGYWATDTGGVVGQYSRQAPNAVMAPDAITLSGGGQPHDNVQPYLCIRYIIALQGIVPPQAGADPLIGQISIFSFGLAPKGWAFCDGQILSIARNQALFSLLGTTYGGDGIMTFGLPNLQSRVAVSSGQGPDLSPYALGQFGGEAAHTLTPQQMPSHRHGAATAVDTSEMSPAAHYWAPNANGNATFSTTSAGTMSGIAVGMAGSSRPHPNMQPSLHLNFCIALQGVFPSRN